MKRTRTITGLLLVASLAMAACANDAGESTTTGANDAGESTTTGANDAGESTTTGAADTTEPAELTPVSLQMHFLPEPAWGTHLYGIEHGIFAEHGIDLELIPGQGSQFSMQQLNENEVQFAQASLIAYLTSKAEIGSETTAVFSPIDHPQAGILTTTPAESLEDLAGTTVGMIPFSVSQLLLPLVLTENGLDPASVTIESVNYSPALLFEGTVDGLEVYLGGNVATLTSAAEQAGVDVYHLDLNDFGLEGYAHSLIVSNELLASDPDLVGRMVAALKESLDAVQSATPEEVADLVTAAAPEIAPEDVIAEWTDYQELINESGLIDEAVVQTNLDYVRDGLGIPHELEAADMYTNEFVPTE